MFTLPQAVCITMDTMKVVALKNIPETKQEVKIVPPKVKPTVLSANLDKRIVNKEEIDIDDERPMTRRKTLFTKPSCKTTPRCYEALYTVGELPR